MAEYIGTNFSAPKLNGQALNRLLYKGIMENVFQNILHVPEKGVTEKYTTNTDGSEVRIIRQLPVTGQTRKLGSSVNGDYFNSSKAEQPQSAEYGIKLLYMYDRNYDIPTDMQDMVDIDLADAAVKNIGGKIATDVNASTTATQLASILNYVAEKSATSRIVTIATATTTKTKVYLDAVLDAATLLDDGDPDNGIQTFDNDAREIICRASFRRGLLGEGGLIVGGSNYAQEMLARGAISPDTYKDNNKSYIGEVDGTPVYVMSSQVWSETEKWLETSTDGAAGVALTSGALDKIQAIMMAASATGRGLAFNGALKTIDSPDGQGIRLQPKYRWGVETFFPQGIVPIASSGFTNPANKTNKVVLHVNPVGSRA